MPKYLNQTLNLSLGDLQAAGNTSEGDFLVGLPLPLDCLVVGTEVVVTQPLVGPNMTAAMATFLLSSQSPREAPVVADLTIAGTYRNGSQQFLLSVQVTGCNLADLIVGGLTATVYYDVFTQVRFPISPI